MLFKYCGIIGLLVNIPITICITVIPPLPSRPLLTLPLSLPTLPLSPSPSLSPHPPSLPHVPSPPSLPHVPSPPSLPHPPFPSLPSLQQIDCPFQPKQSPSYLTPEVAMSDRSAGSFPARSGQSRFGRSLTSRCLLFYPFKNSCRTAKHAA